MAIKRELKVPAAEPEEPPAAAAKLLDSEEEAEARETAVLEEMQVRSLSNDRILLDAQSRSKFETGRWTARRRPRRGRPPCWRSWRCGD